MRSHKILSVSYQRSFTFLYLFLPIKHRSQCRFQNCLIKYLIFIPGRKSIFRNYEFYYLIHSYKSVLEKSILEQKSHFWRGFWLTVTFSVPKTTLLFNWIFSNSFCLPVLHEHDSCLFWTVLPKRTEFHAFSILFQKIFLHLLLHFISCPSFYSLKLKCLFNFIEQWINQNNY